MMEIVFRGKRIDNGKWVEGDLIQLHDGRKYIVNNVHGACIDDKGNFINTEEPFVCQVDPATVGQYTGLHDKNGRRIFEGDIIHGVGNAPVRFGEYAYDSRWKTHVGFYVDWSDKGYRVDIGYWANDREIKVIGNIHGAKLGGDPDV